MRVRRTNELDYDKLISILTDMRELLLKYGFTGQAERVSEMISAAELRSPEFEKLAGSGLMWGSAGSVTDIVFEGNRPGPPEQLRSDDLEFMRLFAQLAHELATVGIFPEGKRQWIEGVKAVLVREGRI
jgi:hypothetical protein